MKGSELKRKLKKSKQVYFVEEGKEHEKWHSDITGKDIRIPRHDAKDIPTGTVKQILKDAGLK